MKRRLIALAVGATVLTPTLSACSQLEEPRDPVQAAAPEAHRGGTLRIGITEPGPIDPMSTTTTAGRLIASTLCDTLLVRDPHTNQLREGLADSWVQGSKGTFVTLRPMHGVKFNDGTALQAKDLSFTLRQVAAAVNDSPYAGLVAPFAGGVLTDEEGEAKRPEDLLVEADAGGVDLAQPLNDYDVQVQSKEAGGNTAGVFAETSMAPISEKAFTQNPTAFRANPVCVGPYRLSKPRAAGDTVLTLVRAPGYYAKNLGFTAGGAGYADTIEFHIYPTTQAVDQAYARGDVDVAVATPVPAKRIQAPDGSAPVPPVKAEPTFDPPLDPADLVRGTPTGTIYLGLARQPDAELNSPVVRQAFSLALDRTALAKTLGPYAEPAAGMVPPALAVQPGRRGRSEAGGVTVPTCGAATPDHPDVAAARALLAKAGIDLSDKIVQLTVPLPPGDGTQYSFMMELKRQLEDAFGLQLTPLVSSWSAVSRGDLAPGSGGFYGMFRMSWNTSVIAPTPTYNDPGLFVRAMFSTDGQESGNTAAWSDPVVEKLLTSMQDTDIPGDQSLLLGQINDRLCEQMPYVPVVNTAPVWRVRSSAVGSALGDLATGTDGQLLVRELYVKN